MAVYRKKECVISFKLTSDEAATLERRTRDSGLSIHQYARLIVRERLDDCEMAPIVEALGEISRQQEIMRRHLRLTTKTILVLQGDMPDAKAEEFVSTIFGR